MLSWEGRTLSTFVHTMPLKPRVDLSNEQMGWDQRGQEIKGLPPKLLFEARPFRPLCCPKGGDGKIIPIWQVETKVPEFRLM